MDWTSSELVSVLYYLLPGFVAAWVFYGLTAHPKLSPFERVVQALIFTAIVQAMTVATKWIMESLGGKVSFGAWTQETGLAWSVLLALFVGLFFSWLADGDRCHRVLRWCNLTSKTSFPSEWFSAFRWEKRWVVLQRSGDRRLYGWPEEWPDHPDSGHFLVDQPE